MAQGLTETERAREIANTLISDDSTVTHRKSKPEHKRHTFDYTGAIHAQKLPDGWEIKGFGSGWFAMGPE